MGGRTRVLVDTSLPKGRIQQNPLIPTFEWLHHIREEALGSSKSAPSATAIVSMLVPCCFGVQHLHFFMAEQLRSDALFELYIGQLDPLPVVRFPPFLEGCGCLQGTRMRRNHSPMTKCIKRFCNWGENLNFRS